MLGKGLTRLKLGGGFCMRDEDMRGRKEGRKGVLEVFCIMYIEIW